jgi:PilZ domain-containing protein
VKFEGGQGWTRDISASGTFFTTEWPFRVGNPIRFTLVLEHVEPGRRQEVTCEGTVVRVESGAREQGVAVSIDSYDLGQLAERLGDMPTIASPE